MSVPPLGNPQTYEIYFTDGSKRFYFKNPNHGMTLNEGNIAWTSDGHAHQAALAKIASVHLQTAALNRSVLDLCRIEFSDGTALTVTNGTANGLPDPTQTSIYRAFVRDLHAHLATRSHDAIRFTIGMQHWRYKALFITMIVAGLFFVATPLVVAIITADLKGLFLMFAGASFCWPFAKMLKENAPRNYAPDQVPDDMLS
jgi:hypothetical protein